MAGAVLSVARRFPGLEALIEARCEADEEFRLLCDDLADAEAALARLEEMGSFEAENRIEEYRLLVDSLAAEVGAAIGAGQVLPFPGKQAKK
jgi:hypothetical protein